MLNSEKGEAFFCKEEIKKDKDKALKNRLQTLIFSKGMSEADFYNSIGISTQYWYFLSWGLWDCPIHLKVKIAKALNTDSSAIFLKGDTQ